MEHERLSMRQVFPEDVTVMSLLLSEGDRLQAQAEGIGDIREALQQMAFCDDGIAYSLVAPLFGLVAMCGIRRTDPDAVKVWLLCTGRVKHFKKSGTLLARETLAKWIEEYGFLWNVVDARQERALRFLESLGATFEEAFVGDTGYELIPYYFCREVTKP